MPQVHARDTISRSLEVGDRGASDEKRYLPEYGMLWRHRLRRLDQTRIIRQLKREGYPFSLSDAKHLSPYLTRHLLRFGKFTTRCDTEPLPENLGLDP